MKNILFFVGLFVVSLTLGFYFYLNSSKDDVLLKVENKITDTNNKVQNQIENITETIAPKPTVMLNSGIPNKHLIETTFVPQSPEKNWDQPWQDACEEAALLTAYYYLENQSPDLSQIKKDLLSLISFEESVGIKKDANLSELSDLTLKHLNYRSQIIDNPTLEEIKTYISKDIPVIVPASGKKLFAENKHFNSGGPYYHALTILGYDDNKNKFIVHDVGTQHGAYFKYSYTLLMDSIHDFPESKNKEDIETGPRRILILVE